MSKQKWELKTHEEKPNWGTGDYDEYYEIVNDRGDAFQAADYEGLEQLADALNGYEGEIRISTALEINLHCDNQLLRAENEKMRKALEKSLEWIADIKQKDIPLDDKKGMALYHIKWLATEALNTNTHE